MLAEQWSLCLNSCAWPLDQERMPDQSLAMSDIIPGSFLQQFNGRAGEWVEAVGPFVCNEVQTSSILFGPSSGLPWEHTSTTGYSTVSLWWKSGYPLAAVMLDQSSSFGVTQDWADSTAELSCPPGHRVSGVYGVYFTDLPYVMSMGTFCRPGGHRGMLNTSEDGSITVFSQVERYQ